MLQTVFLRKVRRESDASEILNAESYLRRSAVNAKLDVVRSRREGVWNWKLCGQRILHGAGRTHWRESTQDRLVSPEAVAREPLFSWAWREKNLNLLSFTPVLPT